LHELRKIRGKDIAMIFQEPMTSLNPVYTVGEQLREVLALHEGLDDEAARKRIIDMFSLVGISDPALRVDVYPHHMSGGMKQRVMIAMALCCSPKLLIADEPTTALDVTVQAQILDLLVKLRDERGMGVMLITHDLGVVAETCDRVVVMYAGRVVETAPVQSLFARPSHPYTVGLLNSLPDSAKPGQRLQTIQGNVPSPLNFPSGCRFRDRCSRATNACTTEPPLHAIAADHEVRCHHPYAGEM
jgi:oligopeptide/dipeptide ABC transporter ATP-binding protein